MDTTKTIIPIPRTEPIPFADFLSSFAQVFFLTVVERAFSLISNSFFISSILFWSTWGSVIKFWDFNRSHGHLQPGTRKSNVTLTNKVDWNWNVNLVYGNWFMHARRVIKLKMHFLKNNYLFARIKTKPQHAERAEMFYKFYLTDFK